MNKEKKVGFMLWETVNGRHDIASSRIRGKWVLKYWDEAEEFIDGKSYEAIIFQKVYYQDFAKRYKGIKILDICDPDWTQGAPFREMIEYCDAVTCPTEMFAQFLRQMTNKPVVVIPDRIDLNFYKERKIHRGRAKECVWHGYSHNSGVLKSAVEALKRLNLGLQVISDRLVVLDEQEDKQGKLDKLHQRWNKWNLNKFGIDMIKSDICIIPGSRKPNDRFKSNNKTTMAWSLGLPVATCVDDLERFIDPIERKKESEKRLEEVKRDYDVRLSIKQYQDLINLIKKQKESKCVV